MSLEKASRLEDPGAEVLDRVTTTWDRHGRIILAVLFGVVYFAQGMWYLTDQPITIVLKDRGLSAGQVADRLARSTA